MYCEAQLKKFCLGMCYIKLIVLKFFNLDTHEESLLTHRLGFCPTPGAQEPGSIFLDLKNSKGKQDFFVFNDPDNTERVTGFPPLQGYPLNKNHLRINLASLLQSPTNLNPSLPN